MIKHHRYGDAFIYEAGMVSPSDPFHIGTKAPGHWRPVLDLGVTAFSSQYQLGDVAKIVLDNLAEQFKFHIYAHGVPAADTPSRFKTEIQDPHTFLQLRETMAEAAKHGYPPRSVTFHVVGPSDNDVSVLFYRVLELLKELANDKTKSASYAKQQIKQAIGRMKPVIIMSYKFGINVTNEKPGRGVTTSEPGFELLEKGRNVIGLAKNNPATPVSREHLADLQLTVENTHKERKEVESSLLKVFYHSLWMRFSGMLNKDNKCIADQFDDALNHGDVRKGYREARNLASPKTVEPPEDTSREPGSNKSLYGDDRVIKRQPRVMSNLKVAASVRGTSITGSRMIVTADPSERQWQNSQGSLVTPKPLPHDAGAWVPVASIGPLISVPGFRIFFAMFFDHPMLKPSSSGQPYWYGNRNHFIEAARHYGELTGDRPHLLVRIIPTVGSKAGIVMSGRDFKALRSKIARHAQRELTELITGFEHAIQEGKQRWLPRIKEKLGNDVKITKQQNIPSNPLKRHRSGDKKGHVRHPEGTTEEKWLGYVNWIRKEGEKVLGLKFGARAGKTFGSGRFKVTQSYKYLHGAKQAAERVKQNVEMTGGRDADGNPTEPFAVYLIEYVMVHRTFNRDHETYMVPLNVIRADEDMPPRRTFGKINKSNFTDYIDKEYHKFGVTHANWKYIRPRAGRRGFPFGFINRPAYASPNDQTTLNRLFARTQSPRIERHDFSYKIDGMHWDAYEMITALPAKVAHEKFGFIERDSYTRMFHKDPNIVNRLKRAIGNSHQGLTDFGTPKPSKETFLSDNPYGDVNRDDLDPNFGIQATLLTGDYLASKIGERWEPKLKPYFNKAGQLAKVYMTGIARENSVDDHKEKWTRYAAKARQSADQIEFQVRSMLKDMEQGVKSDKVINVSRGPNMARAVSVYMQYADKVIDAPDGSRVTIQVPALITKLGLSTFTAPIGSVQGRTVNLSLKAPSEDIARSVIMLKLLRRSSSNRALGKIMRHKGVAGGPLVADFNAHCLAQWAATGFVVTENNDVKGLKYDLPDRPRSRWQMLRAGHMGAFHTMKMLRTD